jgi:hypothetical protein
MTTIIALAATALLVGWVAGGLLLRAGGLLCALVSLMLLPAHPIAVLGCVLGGIAWLAGHWLYAVRHHHYRSPLARRVYLQLLPEHLDATRRWATATTTARADTNAREHRSSRRH